MGKAALYRQVSGGSPSLQTNAFVACATVACTNRPAAGVSLVVPGGAVVNLPATLLPGHHSWTDLAPTIAPPPYPNTDGTLWMAFSNTPPGCQFFRLHKP